MWVMIISNTSVTALLMLLIFWGVQRRRISSAIYKEETATKTVAAGICERLHASYPNAKWRWVCRPAGFAINGGIARIEVVGVSEKPVFMDICLATNGYMALHISNVVELTSTDTGETALSTQSLDDDGDASNVPSVKDTKPYDKESVMKWYNIVLINMLTTLIDDLNAKGEACIHIGHDGKAYVEENGGIAVIHEFGPLPDIHLWGHITDKLIEEGLFAEVREENHIFISWA